MALDLSKLNFFTRLDARARVGVLIIAAITIIFLIYLGTRWLTGGSSSIGPSRIASTPQGLQSIPGGQLTPEYQRALMQANTQAAELAKMSGSSALPTQINVGDQGNANQCNIICSDQMVKVNSNLEDWVRQGKITPEVSAALIKLADNNVSVDEFAANLDQLVKQGKLTPEQARELLAQYTKQHSNALLQESATAMDAMIKSGQLPLEVANELLTAQKNGVSPGDYAAEVQRLVREGKISPATAQQLIAQYAQQYGKETTKKGIAELQKMARNGQITPEVLDDLTRLMNQNVPVDTMAATLKRMVAEGKLTPAAADKILADYKKQKSALGGMQTIDALVQKADEQTSSDIDTLLKNKQISPEVASNLQTLVQNKIPLDEFKRQVEALVKEGKLKPEEAALLIADYAKASKLREQQGRLATLQMNNASRDEYAKELKRMVAAGIISPEQAAKMMQEYVDLTNKAASPTAIVNSSGAAQFAALQQRAQQGAVSPNSQLSERDFAVTQSEATEQTAQERQDRLRALMDAMGKQAGELINSWSPTPMKSVVGSPSKFSATDLLRRSGDKGGASRDSQASGAPLIKAGTIIFAVLDTAINSDYPNSPIMATIVQGKYKNSKLLGKITTSKGVTGQMDRVMLNFTMMNKDEWDRSKSVSAYAIDPDTARTMLASDVDYHYMMRFGAIFATSFIQGYANAIKSSGSTITSGFFGPNIQRPALSPSEKLATAIGQIGTNLGSVTQKYVERPPTVKVDAGVGLGILFMSDVA